MARWARAQGSAPPPWLRGLALGLVAAYLALSAYVFWRAAVLTPFSDEIDWVVRWRELQLTGDWAQYLMSPVNHHRIPLTFGLLAFDMQAFGGTNLPLVLSGAAALGLMAWLLAREAAKAAPPPLGLPAAALAAMAALMACNVLNAATPICVNYVHGASLAVLALVLAEGAPQDGLGFRRLAALPIAVLAGFGDGAALAVWPVLAFGALRRGDRAWLAAVVVTGAAFIGYYAWGQGASTRASTAGALQDPIAAIRLSLNLLILPWTRASVQFAWIGGLVLALTGLAAIALRGGRFASPGERVACALILFSLGVAAMAGLGRAWGPEALNVPLRYTVLMAPLHTGLLILALPHVGELWRANRGAAQALCAAVLVLAATQNALMSYAVVRASDTVRGVIADFQAGQRTPRMNILIHPDLAHAERVFAQMRRDGHFRRELGLQRQAAPR